MKRSIKISSLALVLFAAFGVAALACTNILVGKKASADGSVIITYSADDYGFYGYIRHYAAAKHPAGTKRRIVDGDSHKFLGYIDEAPETYRVMGNINEHQLSIAETTFGGRPELVDTAGVVDYISLMSIGLQRAKTAREAIRVMTDVVQKYGYASSGESFSIADANEAWILEMIGKGSGRKGVVWVAVRIPDDCISAHANQSRIRKFDMKDKNNVMYSPDVISFAREKGYFTGKDADFSFADAYCPLDFGGLRFCEARVWSFFNKWNSQMASYADYVSGKAGFDGPHMPLYIKPDRKLSVRDVMASMRDHYEGTPFDLHNDIGQGPYEAPYRPTPLTWEYEGKTYFNERPISTQQAGFTFVSQLRSWLPAEIGGIMWFGNDEANMIAYTPIYAGATEVPECYREGTADGRTFSMKSAFWVCNWVANMTYPRYSMLFPSLQAEQKRLEDLYFARQDSIEAEASRLYSAGHTTEGRAYLTRYIVETAQSMLADWQSLATYMIVKYNDQTIKPEKDGEFALTPNGIPVRAQRVGFPQRYRKAIVETTGDKFVSPE